MYDTMTTPLSTATPKRAMKPTEAGTLRFWPLIYSDMIPPTSAKGTLSRMSTACRRELKAENNMMKMRNTVSGTMIDSRSMARCCSSNWPPQVTR